MSKEIDNTVILSDLLIRISSLEQLLVTKNLVSNDEINAINKELTVLVTKKILEQANINNIDNLIEEMER